MRTKTTKGAERCGCGEGLVYWLALLDLLDGLADMTEDAPDGALTRAAKLAILANLDCAKEELLAGRARG